jgi:hypothetical protein
LGLDGQLPADFGRPLGHASQAKVTTLVQCRLRVKAEAAILNLERRGASSQI